MIAVETALLRVAKSTVTPAIRWWLGRRREQREREALLIELIGAGITDDLGLRRASRRLDDIVDTVYERLQPLVHRRDDGLPDNEVVAAVNAVADTLDAADLSDKALFAVDLDPVLMAAQVRRELPDAPARAGLNEAAALLYGRLLDECCVCLTQLVVQMGPFQSRATVNILQRLSTIADGLSQLLDRVPMASLDAPRGDRHDVQFRTRYLSHVLDKLDVVELFGVDVHRYRLRTPLSIAYISLAVTGSHGRGGRRGFRWDPGWFRKDDDGGGASVRAEQALGNADRILLRGDAGSGKTTLLQWIVVTAARHGFIGDLEPWNGRTPFLIRLRDYVKQALPPPERFLDKIAATLAGQMPPLWVHRQLAAGAVLLVDGVDEVPESQRREVREWLQDLLRAYRDLRVVVTSRPAAASSRWLNTERFTPVFLERMSSADIKALIRHWHEAVRRAGDLPCEPHRLPGFEQRLLAQLDGSAHLQNIAASPLLCAMLCALNLDRDSNLPRNRMDIYQAAVDMLLHRRDDKRGVHNELPELTSGDQLQLLQEVAWWLSENGRTELSREEAEKRFGQRLAGIRHITAPAIAVLEHMIQRSGILREPIPDRIDFVHRTFQEYLAAREAADQGRAGALLQHAHLDTWRETIILTAGHAHAPVRKELLAGLLRRADQEPQHARKLRLLAAACLETAPAVDPEILDRIRAYLRGLMPRSLAEARSLAAVGEPLLAELPWDLSALTEAQAAATVQTAALINGPAALTTIARYGKDPRPRVQRQLIAVWEYFDPIDYADQVLADAPLDNGSVAISNATLLPALPRLRHVTETHINTSQTVDLTLLADVPHLTNLFLQGRFSGRIEELAKHSEMHTLGLGLNDQQQNLAVLQALPNLTELYLRNRIPDQDLSALHQLPKLTRLTLLDDPLTRELFAGLGGLESLTIKPKAVWDAGVLSPLTKLTSLSLPMSVEPAGGIAELVGQLLRLDKLQCLSLFGCPWVSDFATIAKLENLTDLSIDDATATDLSPLAGLTRLEWLAIGNTEHPLDLTPLGRMARLTDLWIISAMPGLDLTPLGGRRMTVHLPRALELADRAIPSGVRVRRL